MADLTKSQYSEKSDFDGSAQVAVAERPASLLDVPTHSALAVRNRRFNFGLKLTPQPSRFAPGSKVTNHDFDPTPPSERTWNTRAFLSFWMADAWAVSMLQSGSSIAAVTLDWKLAIVAISMGALIMGFVILFNAQIGARLHIPFPVIARSSFGYYLSYFAVFSRAVLAIFWLGINGVTGGQAMGVLLKAIWPSWGNIPNHLPASSGMTSAAMAAYLLYWLAQLPFFWIPYHRIQYFFAFKSVVAPITFFAIFGVTVGKAGGRLGTDSFNSGDIPTSGAPLAWAWLAGLNSVLGSNCTLGLNCSDFSRYATRQRASQIQIFIFPCIVSLVGILGILMAAASTEAYGETMWNPVDMIATWDVSPGGRAGAAFAAIGIIIAQIGINISANSISAANDLTAMAPKYLNIRRGQVLCAIIGGWAFVPWQILAQAQKFLSFMSSYTIFLGPLTGIILVDYYVVKNRKFNVPELYDFHGIYRYNKYGCNWRALAGLLVGFAPCIPGMIHYITPAIAVSTGSQHIFSLSYLYSGFSAAFVYWALSKKWPAYETLLEHEVTGEERILAYDSKGPSEMLGTA